ncbi:MAG: glutamate--cysteine ligase [Candidatus Marinamargulisbacteria bacterium]
MESINQTISSYFDTIVEWLDQRKNNALPMVYSSVDIRESDHKIASVDTNVFPAGFNNLSPNNTSLARDAFQSFILHHYPTTSHILLFCEDHTRNHYYLENVFQLGQMIQNTGCQVTIGSFFKDHPSVCDSTGYLDLISSNNNTVRVYCLNYILNHRAKFPMDVCLLNNDLSDGNYQALTSLEVPIIPDPKMGWHQRKKSTHIESLNHLTSALINDCKLPLDPWLLSTLFTPISSIDINQDADRHRLANAANDLLNHIQQKYIEHGIQESPYLILKSDNGTYGMGVLKITTPDDIRQLNRKNRNKLHKGKSAQPIQHMIIQEGIPSIKVIDSYASEEVIYNVNGTTVGGFYRMHHAKSDRDILNSKGMQFQAFSEDIQHHFTKINRKTPLAGVSKTSYVIAQLANLAAQHELVSS